MIESLTYTYFKGEDHLNKTLVKTMILSFNFSFLALVLFRSRVVLEEDVSGVGSYVELSLVEHMQNSLFFSIIITFFVVIIVFLASKYKKNKSYN